MLKNIKIMWLRFRRNCLRGSIAYADRVLAKKFNGAIYDQKKNYNIKLNEIKRQLNELRSD